MSDPKKNIPLFRRGPEAFATSLRCFFFKKGPQRVGRAMVVSQQPGAACCWRAVRCRPVRMGMHAATRFGMCCVPFEISRRGGHFEYRCNRLAVGDADVDVRRIFFYSAGHAAVGIRQRLLLHGNEGPEVHPRRMGGYPRSIFFSFLASTFVPAFASTAQCVYYATKPARCPPNPSHEMALYWHLRRHVYCAGMGVPVLEMTASEGMGVPVIKMTASERRSFRVPARPYPRNRPARPSPRNRHAVGDADVEPI